jgi:hypothetical protein
MIHQVASIKQESSDLESESPILEGSLENMMDTQSDYSGNLIQIRIESAMPPHLLFDDELATSGL